MTLGFWDDHSLHSSLLDKHVVQEWLEASAPFLAFTAWHTLIAGCRMHFISLIKYFSANLQHDEYIMKICEVDINFQSTLFHECSNHFQPYNLQEAIKTFPKALSLKYLAIK